MPSNQSDLDRQAVAHAYITLTNKPEVCKQLQTCKSSRHICAHKVVRFMDSKTVAASQTSLYLYTSKHTNYNHPSQTRHSTTTLYDGGVGVGAAAGASVVLAGGSTASVLGFIGCEGVVEG